MSTPANNLTPEIYAAFSGQILGETVTRFVSGMTTAANGIVKRAHVLFHTSGGNVGDGITLYNFFRSLPFELILYNPGIVASIGVISYLGAHRRIVTEHGLFMIHRTQVPFSAGTPARRVQTIVDSAFLDDERIEAILRKHLKMPDDMWKRFDSDDLYFSGKQGVEYSFADAVGESSPPAGQRIFSI
jgi:ATP-dependent protease ClpP protease subunit